MELIDIQWIIVESNGNHKIHFHNAGVGGSSPPITTMSHKALSHFTILQILYRVSLGSHKISL